MVCLGNICRSPLAEGILREKANAINFPIFVDSAGTSNYHIGEHPDHRAIENAQSHQVDISKLKARQFSVKDFDAFDIIFAMDVSNYNDILRLTRTDHDKNKVEIILNRLYPKSNKSVPDPYFGGEEGFETVFQLLDKTCDTILHSLK